MVEKDNSIDMFCKNLSQEISERNIMDLSEISMLLKIRINDNLKLFIEHLSSKEEQKYINLLDKQSRNKLGSKEYISIGYELSKAKINKSIANRALNEVKREDNLEKVKKYIIENFGEDKYNEIISSGIKIEKGTSYNKPKLEVLERIKTKDYDILKSIIVECLPEQFLEDIFYELKRRQDGNNPEKINLNFHKPEVINFDIAIYRKLLQKYYGIIKSARNELNWYIQVTKPKDISRLDKTLPLEIDLKTERYENNLF